MIFFNDVDIFILGDIRTYLELLFQLTSFDTTPAGEREGSITSLLTSGDRSLGFLVVPVDTQKKETAPSYCQVGMWVLAYQWVSIDIMVSILFSHWEILQVPSSLH